MSDFNEALRWKTPLAVPITTGSVGSTLDNQTARFSVPTDWDNFWGGIRSDAKDVVITKADGTTKLPFKFTATPDIVARTMDIQVSGWQVPSGLAANLLWMHWSAPNYATDETNGAASAGATPKASVSLSMPSGGIARQVGRLGGVVKKLPAEAITTWFHFPDLARRLSTRSGQLGLEYPAYVWAEATLAASPFTAQTGIVALDDLRFGPPGWVRATLKGGVADTPLIVQLNLATTEGQVLAARCRLVLTDPR
jgi:hypothetical protein